MYSDACCESNLLQKMSGYKLYYFPVRARGEVCRLSFAAAKIDFEDVRLNGEEWGKEKASEYRFRVTIPLLL